MQAFTRRRFDGIAIPNRTSRFRAFRDGKSRSPAIPFVRRRNLATDCVSRRSHGRYGIVIIASSVPSSFFRSGYVGRRCSALARFDVRYFAIESYRERCIIILSMGSRFPNEYDIFGYSWRKVKALFADRSTARAATCASATLWYD